MEITEPMLAGHYDFTIEQGSTFVQEFIWTDNNNIPVPMPSWGAHMQIRNGPLLTEGEKDVLYGDFKSDQGDILVGPTAGSFTVGLTAEQTAALDFTQAQYDIHLLTDKGQVIRILQGTVTLSPSITIEKGPPGEILSAGSGAISTVVVSGPGVYQASVADYVILADTDNGPFTVQLPTAFQFKDVYLIAATGNAQSLITVAAQSGETISGKTSVGLGPTGTAGAEYSSVTLISDGSVWWIV